MTNETKLSRTFPGIRDGEEVRFWVHKHWITHLKIFLVVTFFGAGLSLLMARVFAFLFAESAVLPYLLLLVIGQLLGVWLWGYVRFLDDEFDCLIVTNERVIDITQSGLFKISFSETSLDLIQDVADHTNGIFANLLGYGDIIAQTAAASIVFQIDHIPEPNQLTKAIQEEKKTFLIKIGKRKEAISKAGRDSFGVK